MKKTDLAVLAATLLAISCKGADVTGSWSGPVSTRDGPSGFPGRAIELHLRERDGEITGVGTLKEFSEGEIVRQHLLTVAGIRRDTVVDVALGSGYQLNAVMRNGERDVLWGWLLSGPRPGRDSVVLIRFRD